MHVERFPKTLTLIPQWVVWRFETREGKQTKVPYQPNPARLVRAKSDNPSTWGTLEAALEALRAHKKLEGVGFVFAKGGGIVGVDLDWKGYRGGGIPPEAQTIVDRLGSYVEWSPSRKGCHVLLLGKLPEVPHRRGVAPGVELEVYDQSRYFTMTGWHWDGYPTDLQERQAELEALLGELFPPASEPAPPHPQGGGLSDLEILETLFRLVPKAKNLWDGDTSAHGNDHSRADLALSNHLMWITGNDEARADRLFRQSRLYRPKWNQRHAGDGRSYGQMTLQKARALEPYTPHPGGRLATSAGGMEQKPPTCSLDGRTGGGFVLTGYPRYRVQNGAIEAGKLEREQVVYYRLANFACVIRREISRTDGQQTDLWFELEGYAGPHPLPRVRVRASEFAGMNWPVREWGSSVVVAPGQGARDHLRAAIQYLSEPERATVYTHTGWTRVGEGWAYLHAGGAIGTPSVEVDLPPELSAFTLPEPGRVQDALRLLELAPPAVTWPLLLYALGAPLGHPMGSLYLTGPTGAGKTTLALLVQALWGHDRPGSPASWEATANALEALAFAAKDALLLVDDYAPTGHEGKQKELQAKAGRLLRSQGNATGRVRMRSDGTLHADRPPRGSLLLTGEDLPPGHSVRARCLVLELGRGELNFSRVSALQRDPRPLAAALAAWIVWLAPRQGESRERLGALQAELRPHYPAEHGRTTDALARLHAVWSLLREALEAEGVPPARLDELESGMVQALREVGDAQAEHQRNADPAERFVPLLFALVSSKKAHLLNLEDPKEEPPNPERWGWTWQPNLSGSLDAPEGRWLPQGPQVGWLDIRTGDVLLNPEAGYAALNRLAAEQGEPLPTPRTLWKLLATRGVIRTQTSCGEVRHTRVERIGGHLTRVVRVTLPTPETGNIGNIGNNSVQHEKKLLPVDLPVTGFPVTGPVTSRDPSDLLPEASGNKSITGNTQNTVQDAKKGRVTGVTGFGDIPPPGCGGWDEGDGEWEVTILTPGN